MAEDASYSPDEIRQRFERAVKAGLSTPPLPREDAPTKRAESKGARKKHARKSAAESVR